MNYPSRDQIAQYIIQSAQARGIDPRIALTVAKGEGLNANPAEGWQSNYVKNGRRETSFGPYQLLVGGGLGDKFISQTGSHPRDPSTVFKQIDFALDEAKAGGWGPWYGAKAAGITGYDGIDRAAPSAKTAGMADFDPFRDGGAVSHETPTAAPFNPFEAGAVADDAPSAFTPIEVPQLPMPGEGAAGKGPRILPVAPSQTPQMGGNVGGDFESMAASLAPTDLAIERAKNTEFGAYLRTKAQAPLAGETDADRQARLYGGLKPGIEPSQTRAAVMGAVDLPIVGPALTTGVNALASGANALSGYGTFAENMDAAQGMQAADAQAYPGTRAVGNVAGTLAAAIPLGTTALGAKVLGMGGGPLLARMGYGAGANALIAGADTAVRGGDLGDVAQSAGIGGAIGGIVPVVTAGIGAGYNALRDRVAPALNALARTPENEAGRRIASAFARDAQAGGVNQIDDAAAALNAQDVRLVDRGGETVRALARSASDYSPDARGMIRAAAEPRFETQGDRALGFLYRISGGATDDLAARDAIAASAKAANGPAYAKAFSAPSAQGMWSPGLQDLTGSPAMRAAISGAEGRAANRAAVEGGKQVVNPFVRGADGTMTLRKAADGSTAIPNLQFWDQVKRNLDGMIGKAVRAGDKPLVADLSAVKSKLVSEMDHAVPEYATARRGAAAFFEAEDALDAGKKFVMQTKNLAESAKAKASMSAAEKEAFEVGYAAQLSDVIKQTGDRRNVVNKIWGSKAARDKITVALGPAKAREFEAFVHVETAMDAIRGATGGSQTAAKLADMGVLAAQGGVYGGAGGIAGYMATDGDWRGAALGAVLGGAGRYRESAVAKEVAKLLLSTDPQAAVKATQLALRSSEGMGIIKALSKSVQTMIGAAPVAASSALQPSR